MKKMIASLILLMVLQMACGLTAPEPTATPTQIPPTATVQPTSTPIDTPEPTDIPEPTVDALADSSLVSVTFTVVNQSSEVLKLSWIDWQKNRGGTVKEYARIPAGESYEQQSYFADGWVLHDLAGNIVLLFFATEDDHRTITVSIEEVALAKRNAMQNLTGSIPGTGNMPAAKVTFQNQSSQTLYVLWLDYDGVATAPNNSMILSGGELEVASPHFGDMFTVVDDAGNLVLIYNVTETEPQTVTISDAAVDYRFGLNP